MSKDDIKAVCAGLAGFIGMVMFWGTSYYFTCMRHP